MTTQKTVSCKACTVQSETGCAGCGLGEGLKCRFKLGDLLHFIGLFVTFAVPAVIGVRQSGYGVYLWGWLAFALFFFEVWEIRILCSHCPYYSEDAPVLHCIANYSSLKLWKYHPAPMSLAEKIQLYIGFALIGGYPFPFMLLGGQYAWAATAFLTLGMAFWTLIKTICPTCVNFSCPFNQVPKATRDAYLKRNPTMREAWEASGYKLDDAE